MLPKQIRPIHPGVIIRNDFLAPIKLSQRELANAIGLSLNKINEILLGLRPITPDTSFRLAKFFNTSPNFWITLQLNLDMWDTLQSNMQEYKEIKGVA